MGQTRSVATVLLLQRKSSRGQWVWLGSDDTSQKCSTTVYKNRLQAGFGPRTAVCQSLLKGERMDPGIMSTRGGAEGLLMTHRGFVTSLCPRSARGSVRLGI